MVRMVQGDCMATALKNTHNDIYREVRAFLLGLFLLPEENVIRGYSNNVPLPNGNFILMNIIHEQQLATNEHRYLPVQSEAEVKQSVEVQLQLDFFGEQAGEFSRIFTHLWRDEFACEQLSMCQPLYADNPRYLPFTNEEERFEERWTVTAHLQYNPMVTHHQDFFTEAQGVELHLFY